MTTGDRWIIGLLLAAQVVAALSFIVPYALQHTWRRHPWGRHLMYVALVGGTQAAAFLVLILAMVVPVWLRLRIFEVVLAAGLAVKVNRTWNYVRTVRSGTRQPPGD